MPFLMASPCYTVFMSGIAYGRVLALAGLASALYGAFHGVWFVLQYKRRREALTQEVRDYEAALARAVDFNQA